MYKGPEVGVCLQQGGEGEVRVAGAECMQGSKSRAGRRWGRLAGWGFVGHSYDFGEWTRGYKGREKAMVAIVPMREDDLCAGPGVHQGCREGGGEDVLVSRYVLKVEPTGCSGGWLEGLEGQRQADSRVAGLRNRKGGAALVECREAVWEDWFGAVGSQFGHVKLQGPVEQLGAHGQWAGEPQQSLR